MPTNCICNQKDHDPSIRYLHWIFDYFILNSGIENVIQIRNYSKKVFSKKKKGF